mgnify:CR=1 FL=1
MWVSGRGPRPIRQARGIPCTLPLGLVLVGSSIFLLTLEAGPPFGTWGYALGWGCRALGSWCCVLAAMGFGMRRLNFSNAFVRYANEAVLPFYILHQPVLLTVALFVVQWAIPDLLKLKMDDDDAQIGVNIVKKSLEIAGAICIYTNMNHTIETLE